jgi:hypothetical protein
MRCRNHASITRPNPIGLRLVVNEWSDTIPAGFRLQLSMNMRYACGLSLRLQPPSLDIREMEGSPSETAEYNKEFSNPASGVGK